MAAEAQLTPMMAQYRRIKSELPKDALLLFRLGDFYEMFFEDAQIGAQFLNVALTKRGVIPMCGIPFHAANGYIADSCKAGRKVAICDQIEEARPGQLVKREVTQILSPGTHFDERMLTAERNNFLAAICALEKRSASRWLISRRAISKSPNSKAKLRCCTELERLAPGRNHFSRRSIGAADIARPGSAILQRLRRLGVRAGDGAFHRARSFQSGVAGWIRSEESRPRPSARRARSCIT